MVVWACFWFFQTEKDMHRNLAKMRPTFTPWIPFWTHFVKAGLADRRSGGGAPLGPANRPSLRTGGQLAGRAACYFELSCVPYIIYIYCILQYYIYIFIFIYAYICSGSQASPALLPDGMGASLSRPPLPRDGLGFATVGGPGFPNAICQFIAILCNCTSNLIGFILKYIKMY